MAPGSWLCDCSVVNDHTPGVRCRDQRCKACGAGRCPPFVVARLHAPHLGKETGTCVVLDWWQLPCIRSRCAGMYCPFDHDTHPGVVERIRGAETRVDADHIVMHQILATAMDADQPDEQQVLTSRPSKLQRRF